MTLRPTLILLLGCLVIPLAAHAAESRTEDANDAFAPLEWLHGTWQAAFLPDGGSAPTMTFSWGDSRRSYLRHTGTRPTPEGLKPEYEMMIVWNPVRDRFEFLTTYHGGEVVEDGAIQLIGDAVRLHMKVYYAPGATLPFSDGAIAGEEGHSLEFQRTFHPDGDDGLRGTFVIKRGGRWEQPHFDVEQKDGFRWRRLAASSPAEERDEN